MVVVVYVGELFSVQLDVLVGCKDWFDNVYYGVVFCDKLIWNNIVILGLFYNVDLWDCNKNVILCVEDEMYVVVVDVCVVQLELEGNVVCIYV